IRAPLVTGVQTCALPIFFERVSPIWRQGPCLWVCNSHTLWSLLSQIQPYTSRAAAPTYLMGFSVYVDERADGLYFMPAKEIVDKIGRASCRQRVKEQQLE